MKKLLISVLLAAFAASLQACTSKGSNLVPLVSQHPSQPITVMDGTGGGPSSNCGESGCPDPTPTP